MNLETRVEAPLWEAIRASVEARNFSAAALDGIHYLSEVIRERSGLEGDGVALVGAAFGGDAPKLKVNRLQTESERNVQRGVEALLRGLYQAIRNPRSHGTCQDDERAATAIILFVDYLLRIVDQSRAPFTMAAFTAKVFDAAFVPKKKYAELLAGQVPENRRLAVVRELFARRSEGNFRNTAVFVRVMLAKMKVDEVAEFYDLVSEELAITDDDDTLMFVLTAVRGEDWRRVSEAARMRCEHKLIGSVRTGKYKIAAGRCLAGGLGSWATQIVAHFDLADDLWRAVAGLLRGTELERDYALALFMRRITECFAAPPAYMVSAINERLKAGDNRFKELVDSWARTGEIDSELNMVEKPADDPWRKPFETAREKFTPAVEIDDIPF
jgi:uncharacterized protein (TIGR02391 family)